MAHEIAVQIADQISEKCMANLLANALESGSTYWCRIDRVYPPPRYDFRIDGKRVFAHVDAPMSTGGSLLLSLIEEAAVEPLRLDKDAMKHGLHLMSVKYPHHFADLLAGNDDAITADVFLQLSLLGEIVYG